MDATKQALAELKTLAKAAADTLYRRIELADQVLGDLDWIAREHGGSDLKAQDALQSEFFAELGDFITFGKLRAMFRDVPKAKWREARYNIAAVEAIYDEQAPTKGGEKGKRTAWKAIAEKRGEELEKAQEKIAKLEGEIAKQEGDIATLRDENNRLKGRVEQMERMLTRETVGV